jgi:deoxyadenosine kinase
MGENSIFVAFAGLMGAGKTKQAKALAKLFGLRHCSTQPVEENPYLEQFYADKASCSFQMQIYLLKARFEEHRDCSSCVRAAVQDRSIYDDLIFAEMLTKAGHMSKLDLQTYQEFFATIIALVDPPKCIIFLDVSPEIALARIRKRGRACEAGITIEYMRDLHAQYEESFAKVTRGIPVLRVPEFFDLKASIQKLLDEGIYDDTDY